MKRKIRTFACKDGEALLATLWQKGEELVTDFSCVESLKQGSKKAHVCMPGESSKFAYCEIHECPEGYAPWMSATDDGMTGRVGVGFHCVPTGRTKEQKSIGERFFPNSDSVPG